MLNAIAIGDLHLDGLKTLFPDMGTALQISAIERVLDYAASKGVERIVYLGDIADKSTMSEDSRISLFTLIEKYRKYLKQDIILGNHDISSEGVHSLKSLKFVVDRYLKDVSIYTEPTQVVHNGVSVNYLPYPTTQVPSSVHAHSLNLAHVDRAGAVRDNGYKTKKGADIDSDQYWIIGHLHTSQQVGKKCFFPGTLYQMSFGESLPKGFAHFRAKMSKSGRLLLNYEWIEQKPPYTLTNLAIDDLKDLEQVTDNKFDLYKLFVGSRVVMPRNYLSNKPNVIQTIGYSNKQELKELLSPDLSTDLDTSNHLQMYFEAKSVKPVLQRRAFRLHAQLTSNIK